MIVCGDIMIEVVLGPTPWLSCVVGIQNGDMIEIEDNVTALNLYK
jgi:hypothetical protein